MTDWSRSTAAVHGMVCKETKRRQKSARSEPQQVQRNWQHTRCVECCIVLRAGRRAGSTGRTDGTAIVGKRGTLAGAILLTLDSMYARGCAGAGTGYQASACVSHNTGVTAQPIRAPPDEQRLCVWGVGPSERLADTRSLSLLTWSGSHRGLHGLPLTRTRGCVSGRARGVCRIHLLRQPTYAIKTNGCSPIRMILIAPNRALRLRTNSRRANLVVRMQNVFDSFPSRVAKSPVMVRRLCHQFTDILLICSSLPQGLTFKLIRLTKWTLHLSNMG